jgi:hypothetical protein
MYYSSLYFMLFVAFYSLFYVCWIFPSVHKSWHQISSTSGGNSVGIVRLRTKATEFVFCFWIYPLFFVVLCCLWHLFFVMFCWQFFFFFFCYFMLFVGFVVYYSLFYVVCGIYFLFIILCPLWHVFLLFAIFCRRVYFRLCATFMPASGCFHFPATTRSHVFFP